MNNTALNRLVAALNKWRLAFLAFVIVYFILLLANLTNPPIQWDEVIHLNGGSFLYWGLYGKFVQNAFYPPLFDTVTFLSFKAFGVSLFAARMVPVLFSVLSLWAVFELAHKMYGGKEALLSAVLLGVMPGYFWLSKMAMLETMLVFFTTISLLFFYLWLTTRQDKMLVITGLAIGLGFLTKYQMIVAGFIMLLSILFLARNQLKLALKKFSLIVVTAFMVVIPWVIIAYRVYAAQIFSQWLYALQVGNPERSFYSERFPAPFFYFIEMVWPYDTVHPISIFIYIAGLAGLVFFALRRRPQDKYILIWFVSVFVIFTLITNKEWRYVLPIFPALAISAALAFLSLFDKLQKSWRKPGSVGRKRLLKAASVLLVIFMVGTVAYSINDAYGYVSKYDIKIEIEQATTYALAKMEFNKSIMVLCPFNFFSLDMVRFYLWVDGNNEVPVFQYPLLPVDTYTPAFNVTELIHLCKKLQVQYLFTYENGGTVPYYNTTLNLREIYEQLYESGNFTHISNEATFGVNPRRIFVLTFTG